MANDLLNSTQKITIVVKVRFSAPEQKF